MDGFGDRIVCDDAGRVFPEGGGSGGQPAAVTEKAGGTSKETEQEAAGEYTIALIAPLPGTTPSTATRSRQG